MCKTLSTNFSALPVIIIKLLKMQHILFSWSDCALFIITIGLSAAIGIYFGFFKKQNTTKDYLHGGKKMKVFPVAMSLAARYFKPEKNNRNNIN